MIVICEECGAEKKMSPSQFKRSKNHFCSVQCHMKFMNRKLNPTRMTPDVRKKISDSRLDSGNKKTYQKLNGRHTHRIVAEQILGRPLQKGEIVHHIDGNKRNNEPSNLTVMTQSEHCRLHFKKGGGLNESISTSN